MSTGSAIHVEDAGTTFEVTVTDDCVPPVAIDLSSATLLEFCFQPPTGAPFARTPVFVSGGTDGKLSYVTVAGDLVSAGSWKLQVHYVLPGNIERRADVLSFVVKENVQCP